MNSFTRGQNSYDVELKGKVSWVRMVQPNKYDKWSLTLHPDTESLNIIRDLQAEGVKNVIKKDDDNQYYLQISRPTTVELRKGVKSGVTPPIITDMDGRPMEGMAIGNGTDGTVICEVYSHPVPNSDKRAKALRLAGLKIENLVPFNIQTDYGNPQQSAQAQRLADAKPQSVWEQ